ncbi:histidine phosphatase family protein [Kitasatospora sp. NPDC090308]|uniref:histidine phosphatase family protein n=1 Tax=Kitasatospora sp. NPDC090308 TaxID=3364082 RepID=UPI0038136603
MSAPVELLVRRHARSRWNAEHRIQGQAAAPGLAADGTAESRAWAGTLSPADGIRTVWSSTAARAIETATPAAHGLGARLRSNPVLNEVGAGRLEGLTHDQAARRHPDCHRVWTARGDLDAIPGAETGDALQARALAFLAIAAGPSGAAAHGTRQLAVTHAAFLRSLVNTAERRERTLPVPIRHTDLHRLTDPWARLDPTELGAPWRPAVHRVDTGPHGTYLVKVLAAPDGTADLARHRARHDAVAAATGAPALLAAVPRPGGGAVTVRRHLPGSTVPHRIGPAAEWQLHAFYRRFSERVAAALDTGVRSSLPSLRERVDAVLAGPATEASGALRTLVAGRGVAALLADRSTVADFDLHRDNTLRTATGLTQIDFDGLCTGPRQWADACALVGASALYPAPADGHNRPHVRLLAGDTADLRELRLLVEIRLLLGLSFFLTGARAHGGQAAGHYADLYRQALAAYRPLAGRHPEPAVA